MDDLRIAWMKDRVCIALGLKDANLFQDLLKRDDDYVRKELLNYLDTPSKQFTLSVLFYSMTTVSEVEEDVMEGLWSATYCSRETTNWTFYYVQRNLSSGW